MIVKQALKTVVDAQQLLNRITLKQQEAVSRSVWRLDGLKELARLSAESGSIPFSHVNRRTLERTGEHANAEPSRSPNPVILAQSPPGNSGNSMVVVSPQHPLPGLENRRVARRRSSTASIEITGYIPAMRSQNSESISSESASSESASSESASESESSDNLPASIIPVPLTQNTTSHRPREIVMQVRWVIR